MAMLGLGAGDVKKRLILEVQSTYHSSGLGQAATKDVQGLNSSWAKAGRLASDAMIGVGVGAGMLGAISLKAAVQTQAAAKQTQAQYGIQKKAMGDFSTWVKGNSSNLLQSQSAMWGAIGQASIAGFGPKVTEQIAAGAAKMATTFQTSVGNTTSSVTAIIRAFGVQAKQIPAVMNEIALAASKSGQGMGLFSGSIGRVLLQAKAAGVSLPAILGMAATVGRDMPGGSSRAMMMLGTLMASVRTGPSPGVLGGMTEAQYQQITNLSKSFHISLSRG